MGSHAVVPCSTPELISEARRRVLLDIRTLETMLCEGWVESRIQRIGAEQELHLVDGGGDPAPLAPAILKELAGRPFCHELATFNLEANLSPQVLGRGAFTALEAELRALVTEASAHARAHHVRALSTGILPSATRWHLTRKHMVRSERFDAMERETLRTQGGEVQVVLRGIDDLELRVPTIMLEGCATSFQVHLQVAPQHFPATYNAAQLALGPVLALGANSPLFVGRRLWHETRVPLLEACASFQGSADVRRGRPGRMGFGSGWMRHATDLFKEDLLLHPPLFAPTGHEHALETLFSGVTPALHALRLHNGTIARWNRPCYGVVDGTPHLRIECRALPAGPTLLDEVANAAFWIGLTRALVAEVGDVSERIAFSDARSNFYAAAHRGVDAALTWLGGERRSVADLVRRELLPLARQGLLDAGVSAAEAERYLGVIAERAATGRTGAVWMLEATRACAGDEPAVVGRRIADVLAERLLTDEPVHAWAPLTARPRARLPLGGPVGVLAEPVGAILSATDSAALARLAFEHTGLPALPIADAAGRLLGMLEREEVMGKTAPNSALQVGALMTRCPHVRGDTPAERVRSALSAWGKALVFVVDESDQLVGVVTAARLGIAAPAPAVSVTHTPSEDVHAC